MIDPDRRLFLTMLAGLMGPVPAWAQDTSEGVEATPIQPDFSEEPTPFSEELLHAEARALAAAEWKARPSVPEAWRELTFDQHEGIRFDPRSALWEQSDKPIRLDFYPPGLYFPRPVDIRIVKDGQARKVNFNIDLFTMGQNVPDLPLDDSLGFSGFGVRGAVGGPDEFREFAVFQGASYFRAIARHQNYGISARGLALRTGDPEGEEFPEFVKFWVQEPDPGDSRTMVHALMDSPSLTGVYRFMIEPGDTTVMDVRSTLYPRVDLDNVGVAPLTSMFLFDETNRNRFDDYRPAVHDSDGLLAHNRAGELIWRPLSNPVKLQISDFFDRNPRGFGLMQRSRRFSDFADLESNYHTRPSLWIEPDEDWGEGAVRLIEIPADREIYDNMVAFWKPREPIQAGSETSFNYRMYWGKEARDVPDVSRVLNTRLGARREGGYFVAIDFAEHSAIPEDLSTLDVRLSSNRGELSSAIIQRNPETKGPRLAFTLQPGDAETVELRAQLLLEGETVSEVFLYRWTAK